MSLLSLARDLKRRKGRERRSLFVAEGVRAVEDLIRSGLPVRGVLVTPQLRESAHGSALAIELETRGMIVESVGDREFSSASETESPQGVLAIAETPGHTLESISGDGTIRVVVLDGIQDPGNAGTILRTASALGAAGAIALPGTVDLWNPKVVRGAMGAHFRFPLLHATVEEFFTFLDRAAMPLWGSAVDGEPLGGEKPPKKLALALGNEGSGLSDAVRSRCERLVSIPIDSRVESLNVAVADGIILHELRG